MYIDKALNDNSANLARKILKRGIENMTTTLESIFGFSDFSHVACSDFSISLRQRRLILGLPIGSYVNWKSHEFFPLELDINSCGVHILKLRTPLNEKKFRQNLDNLQKRMNNKEIVLDGVTLKWNFSRRNHFINVYQNEQGEDFVVFHASGETKLFDWEYLNSIFDVKHIDIEDRKMPYIIGNDVQKYWNIAKQENDFFYKRHSFLFKEMFEEDFDVIFADFHFGMLQPGEILMGCSKVKIGNIFPVLTRPFEKIYIAEAGEPDKAISSLVGDDYTLVPHGLGMTVPDEIVDIIPDEDKSDYVTVLHKNGSRMITDTLEYVGVSYRNPAIVPQMATLNNFKIKYELFPKICLKL